jgi:nucleotide-binding universal stress UspA family protein
VASAIDRHLTVNELLLPLIYGDAWSAAIPTPVDESILEEVKKIAAAHLETIGRELEAAGIAHEMVIVDNEQPWKAILEAASRHGCDAIFMASHGRHGFDALVLGSQTHKVLTHTELPVLVFR